jgi:hypothetical protein
VGNKSFVYELLSKFNHDDHYDDFDLFNLCLGDWYDVQGVHSRIFPGAAIEEMILIRSPQTIDSESSMRPAIVADMSEAAQASRITKLKEVCQAIKNINDKEELMEISGEVERHGLNQPSIRPESPLPLPIGCERLFAVFPCWLRFQIPSDAECIDSRTTLENGTEVLNLRTPPYFDNRRFDDGFAMGCLDSGCVFQAPIISSTGTEYEAQTLIKLLVHSDTTYEFVTLKSIGIHAIWEKFQDHTLVEGVVAVDDVIGADLRNLLMNQIDALVSKQEHKNAVDYHPNSGNIVRDIIHPALYPYVEGVTPLRAKVQDSQPCTFPTARNTVQQEAGKDFWGRPYEISKYQWLPTHFQLSLDGRCTIEDYINNLTPRDDSVNSPLYASLSRLFEHSLPYIESVYSYVHAVRSSIRDEEEEFEDDGVKKAVKSLVVDPVSLRGQRLQVITKIVDYELKPGQRYEGVWHVEGMSHEEIVLTALYILDRDNDIEGGALEFQRAFLRDEAAYVFSRVSVANRPPKLNELIEDGLIPLGKVETSQGRLIVFPNSHVHKVGEMLNQAMQADDGNDGDDGNDDGDDDDDDGDKKVKAAKIRKIDDGDDDKKAKVAKRRIVVFFLVNPMQRIISTREVAPQHGVMAHKEALEHRLALMRERKFQKQDWNVRFIELCEH